MQMSSSQPIPAIKPPSALAHSGFALYWTARMVSLLGDQVFTVAFAPLVLALTGSSSNLGQFFAVFSVCQVAFLVVGGIVADRAPRKRIMIATDVVQAVTLLVTLVLLWQNQLEVWHLFVLAILFGTASAFFMPASSSLLPEVVPTNLLVQANALSGVGMQAIGVLGPAVGGVLNAWGGSRLSFAINATSFALSALCLAFVKTRARPEPAPSGPTKSSVWQDLVGGYQIVKTRPWLWITIALFALVNVFDTGVRLILLPTISQERFGGSFGLGWLLSSLSAGAVVTALVLTRLPKLRKRGWWGYGSFVMVGVGMVVLSQVQWLPLAVLITFLIGACHMIFGVIWPVTVQELVPTEAQGRVWSLDMIGSFALLPFGYVLSGWCSSHFGTTATMLVYGATIAALMLLGLCAKAVRSLD